LSQNPKTASFGLGSEVPQVRNVECGSRLVDHLNESNAMSPLTSVERNNDHNKIS